MKIIRPTTVQEAVANGAALLDEKMPGWVDKIHLEDLQMRSPCACVLGQLFGNFRIGADKLQIDDEFCDREGDLRDHGFDLADREDDLDYMTFDDLDREWTKLITERKAKYV